MGKLITTGYHLPYDPDLVERAREMRNNPTYEERRLWLLCLRGLKPPFYRQRPIDHFIVDFYCPALKLVVEIDGDSHFDDHGIAYDEKRTAVLESYGLKVLRFTNDEIEHNIVKAKKNIEDILSEHTSSPL